MDRTADLTGLVDDPDVITRAVETEPGRLTVDTTLKDTRTPGSESTAEAVAVCEAGRTLVGDGGYVAVLEADGTTLAVAGHPAYGPQCAEV